MKKVITYDIYGLLSRSYYLFRRVKELGDYLIVGVTSDSFDLGRGKLNVHINVLECVEAVKAIGYADEMIIENYLGQKIDDFHEQITPIPSLPKLLVQRIYCRNNISMCHINAPRFSVMSILVDAFAGICKVLFRVFNMAYVPVPVASNFNS